MGEQNALPVFIKLTAPVTNILLGESLATGIQYHHIKVRCAWCWTEIGFFVLVERLWYPYAHLHIALDGELDVLILVEICAKQQTSANKRADETITNPIPTKIRVYSWRKESCPQVVGLSVHVSVHKQAQTIS